MTTANVDRNLIRRTYIKRFRPQYENAPAGWEPDAAVQPLDAEPLCKMVFLHRVGDDGLTARDERRGLPASFRKMMYGDLWVRVRDGHVFREVSDEHLHLRIIALT